MGIDWIVIGVAVAISAAMSIYAMSVAGKQKNNNMSPQSLDSFGITQAKEGSVVPYITGRVRIPGNIVYYGNLVTEEIESDGGGGKGFGGGGGQVVGYRYYLDVWQTIALAGPYGKINLIDTYVNDNHEAPEAAEVLYNDGTTDVSPAAYVPGANALRGVAHIFYRRLYLGENVTQVPTIHFVVEKVYSTGLTGENLANGSNPAAILYDMAVMGEIKAHQINFAFFEAAAIFWQAKGYGLNLTMADQKHLYQIFNLVGQQVDYVPFLDGDGKLAIQPFDPDQEPVVTIETDDFYEFSLQRPAYSQLPNYLRATFCDQDQDFTDRVTSPWVNDAGIQAVGRVLEKSFDLKGFRDIPTAQDRLAEIAKYVSYPVAKIGFATDFRYASLVPGQVISVINDDLGIVSAKFRLDSVDFPAVDSLNLQFKATQVAEALFDTNTMAFDGSEYARDPVEPSSVPAARTELLLPYNPKYGTTPHRIFLVERADDHENGYMVQVRAGSAPAGPPYIAGADADQGYHNAGFLRSFSVRVNLYQQSGYAPAFFDETYTIDDGDDGIVIYCDGLDLTRWPDISRAELFSTNRFLFLGILDSSAGGDAFESPYLKGELIAFQGIEPIENPDLMSFPDASFYRITSFLRGALYTGKHSYDDTESAHAPVCFLFSIADNVLQDSDCGNYRVILPNAMKELASPADTHPFFPLNASFALTPQASLFDSENICGPGRIYATRSGSSITVKYYPCTYASPLGAGKGNPDEVTDSEVFDYIGSLFFEHDATAVEKISPDVGYSITDAAEVTLSVYQRLPGRIENAVYGELVIGTNDGTYVAYTERIE